VYQAWRLSEVCELKRSPEEMTGINIRRQHHIVSREKHLFERLIRCSCGAIFRGYGFDAIDDAERKFAAHLADPYKPDSAPPEMTRRSCPQCGEIWWGWEDDRWCPRCGLDRGW
jgi:hypothetical protein